MHRLLVLNPGSTSTKVAVYEDEQPSFVETLRHSSEEIGAFAHVLDQYDFRLNLIVELLHEREIALGMSDYVLQQAGVDAEQAQSVVNELRDGLQSA